MAVDCIDLETPHWDSEFDNNISFGSGGGVYSESGETILQDCPLTNNTASVDGGGMYISNNATMTDCNFSNNDSIGNGGGIWITDGSIHFTELRSNYSGSGGGGLYSASSTGILLEGCLICENEPDWIEGEWIDGTGNDFPVNCPNDCDGDYDSDGFVNVIDVLGLIGDWGSCPDGSPCPGDFNEDGYVNVSDLLAVIDNWGPCE